ncbi:MAG TPA: translation elongation factor 4 [Patescibacteria group bacterium]|jgi:GTP-binding protein LepA|nr:translation elongation factor 4 [Patescibacteria group bacterium]
MIDQTHIRNFCIIAHIDHGKSTLADRLLELTNTIEKRDMKAQLLDSMDLEREKGITIKLQPVRMYYHASPQARDSGSAEQYQLNLIDTPGHVDFSYEVSRSLAACEGALLVVDASQGIQAQTLANVYLAMEADLTIIPVLNKIDLPAADVERVSEEIMNLLGCNKEDILQVSAKTGLGVDSVLDAVVQRVPPPHGQPDAPTRALLFDSVYDDYRGVILYVRIVDGQLKKDSGILMMSADSKGQALEVGALIPKPKPLPALQTGEIGYVVTNLKSVAEARVGDTLTLANSPAAAPLAGYSIVKPFVYAGVFPSSADDYPVLKDALEKLQLNDAALQFSPENSQVLGHGFRIGFLGLLHMEIVQERLERSNNFDLIVTNPSTDYKVELLDGTATTIQSAAELPDVMKVQSIREPWIKGEIVAPQAYLGSVLQLIVSGRGVHKNIGYLDSQLAVINFEAPLANMLTDFYDQLKSVTSGYGSFNYELADYRAEDLVRLDILVAGERIDSLSMMVHRSEAPRVGREFTAKLKDVIPRQLFEIRLQAAINGRIIASESIKALSKNVTGHLYGGDVSRKKKLWAKQKEGKKRLKKFGKVEIPNEAFSALLKR